MKDLVFVNQKKEAVTTSRIVAEEFEKRHDNVLQIIMRLKERSPDIFNALKIKGVKYVDEKGEKRKEYKLSRDAYSFVAMSFTGKKADKFKFQFIQAFSEMETWIKERLQNSLEYKIMSDTLHEVRLLAGKDTKHFHYATEAKLVNWAMTGEFKPLDREALSQDELDLLYALQKRNTVLMGAGMIYQDRKEALKIFTELRHTSE